jgi:hypothetical protein
MGGSPENKMAKRPRSAKQLANDERLRNLSKQKKLNEQIINSQEPSTDPAYEDLLRQIKEANEAIQQLKSQVAPQTSAAPLGGKMVGTVERYVTSPGYYPDPTERLAKEPKLAKYAFDYNYELSFEVQLSQYETIDHIRQKEPRFVLKLIVKVYDEDTGELTNRRFVILQGVFHEDPDAAIMIARDNGIEIDEQNEREFLNEMRYLRFRDWLIEAFYPTPPPPSANKKEMVIGNKLVEVYEVTSDKSESMGSAFANMTKKL